jgi:arylsulfatase A-like enzyme
MLSPRLFLLLLLFTLNASARRPNVIFILADDLGWSDTTLYGTTKFYQTPNIERLAKRGVTFTRAYSASPLCSPTRSAILTGLSPARTGITAPNSHVAEVILKAEAGKQAPPAEKSISPTVVTRLQTSYPTLPRSLKNAGYVTGHFGKWHLGTDPYSPLQHGFDVDLPHWPGPGPAGSFLAPWKFKDFDADPAVPDQHIEDRMAQEAVKFMEKNQHQSFYLNYWMFSVHAPFDAKKALIEKHRARVDPKDAQRSPTYAAMVESMDDAIGTLLDALDRLKLAENTIIIFTSDNGGNMYNAVDETTPTSNRPWRGGKATLFEGGTRVPCVIVWPGVTQPGARSDAMIQSEDYYPTLLAGLNLPQAPELIQDGKNFLPVLKGETPAETPKFQYFPHSPGVPDWLPPAVSVHRGEWKLIRIFHGGDNGAHRHQLYHLGEDPGETKNLAQSKPELVAELDALIEAFLTKNQAVRPVPNPSFDPAKYRPELEGKSTMLDQKKTAAGKKAATVGWRAANCQGEVKEGIMHLTAMGDASFLGLAVGRHKGPTTVTFRIKAKGGKGHLDWLPDGPAGKANRIDFTITGDGWEEISVKVPADGPVGVIRLYPPPQTPAMALDWIDLKSEAVHSRLNF